LQNHLATVSRMEQARTDDENNHEQENENAAQLLRVTSAYGK